jgi:isopenicillin N synthase-like dioxygenase
MNSRKVPVLSLKKYISGSEEEKAQFCSDLFDGFKNYGFIVIEDHPISADLLKKAYGLSKEFFSLPDETKEKHILSGASGQRGFVKFKTEHAKSSPIADLKEFFHLGRELPEARLKELKYFPNVWPIEVNDFKETFLQMYNELEKTGKLLLEALTPSLEVEKTFFDDRVTDGNNIIRLLHYPKMPDGVDPDAIRAQKHTDIDLLTLLLPPDLPPNSDSGLQVLDSNGEWISIITNPNNLIINIGDMMEILTNGVLKSTLHRVKNPTNTSSHKQDGDYNVPRYSAPYFIHVRGDVLLECLPKFIGDGVKFESITGDDFLQQRLKEIGLKK